MKKQLVLMALGVVALGCGSDPTSVASVNPDPASCLLGSIAPGDSKTGVINSASCVAYDHVYNEDSEPFDSYKFVAEKGKGYQFNLRPTDTTFNWDALLQLVTVNPATGGVDLLAISDDEGGNGSSQFQFIAPVSGTFYLRAGGYALDDTAHYTLSLKSCDSPLPQITGSLATTTQSISLSDCVITQPDFAGAPAHVKLYSILVGPNETKTITVTSNDFPAGFQVFGPAWGVDCDYAYQGCGGGVGEETKGNPQTVTINGSGDEQCDDALHAPDHIGPLASRVSASVDVCEFFSFPGQYTLAVGTADNLTGSFTVAVSDDTGLSSVVGSGASFRNPTLEFLRNKPLHAHQYLNRSH